MFNRYEIVERIIILNPELILFVNTTYRKSMKWTVKFETEQLEALPWHD